MYVYTYATYCILLWFTKHPRTNMIITSANNMRVSLHTYLHSPLNK